MTTRRPLNEATLASRLRAAALDSAVCGARPTAALLREAAQVAEEAAHVADESARLRSTLRRTFTENVRLRSAIAHLGSVTDVGGVVHDSLGGEDD